MHRSKTCFKCHKKKSLDEFYKHTQMADGRLNKCKECTKRDVRENRRKRVEYYREYDRERGNRQGPEYQKMLRVKWPQQYRAQNAVSNAVRDGKVHRPEVCEACDKTGLLHAHHDDYLKPIDVRWLCPACHKDWHDKHGPGKNRRI